MIAIILVFIIVAVVAVFSVQNATPVAISFLFWKFEASLAIIIFLSVLSSVVITIIAVSSRSMRRSLKKGKKDVSRERDDLEKN